MRGIRIIIACTRMLAAILAPKEGRNNLQVAFAFPESMKILVLPGWDHLALHQYSAVSWDEKNNDGRLIVYAFYYFLRAEKNMY